MDELEPGKKAMNQTDHTDVNVLEETSSQGQLIVEHPDRVPSIKILLGPSLHSKENATLQGPDHTEHSDCGTSSSTSTFSNSSAGRRSKSRDSRHSSDEVIGEETLQITDDEIKESNPDQSPGINSHVPAPKKNESIVSRVVADGNGPGTEVISSDTDSAFEDQPLADRGRRSKKRTKPRKSAMGSMKSLKLGANPNSKRPSSFKGDVFPFSSYTQVVDRSPEIELFNMEISPVQGFPLILEDSIGLFSKTVFSGDMTHAEIIGTDSSTGGVVFRTGVDVERNVLEVDKPKDGHNIDDHQRLLCSPLEDKEVDELNQTLRFTSQEFPNHQDSTAVQPPIQSADLESVEPKPTQTLEYDIEWVPPDGGWGWLVLLASIIVNILIPGTVKSFGVLFIEFIEVFKATPAAASWIPALSYWLYSSTGPFATALAIKFSHRSVTVVGGLLAAAGLMISYFATSIEYLYVSYGLIGGLGAGLAYPIGVIMVGQYFRRRIGLANGLCTSGSALGSVLMPPLLRYLLSKFGYRGAILILGAILLNVCIVALFYEPVEKHLKEIKIPRKAPAENVPPTRMNGISSLPKIRSPATSNLDIRNRSNPYMRDVAMSMPIAIPMPNSNDLREGRERRGSGSIKKATFHIGNETPADSWSLRSNEGTSPLAARFVKEDPGSPKIYHSSNLRSRPFPCSLESTSEMESLFNTHLNISSGGAPSTQASNAASRSKLNLTAIPEDEDQSDSESRKLDWNYYGNLTPIKQRLMRLSAGAGSQAMSTSSQPQNMNTSGIKGLSRTLSVASNVSNSSFHYVSTIHHGSLLTTMQFDKTMPDFASTLTLKSVRQSCWKCWFEAPKRLLMRCGICPNWAAANTSTTDQARVAKKTFDSWSKFIDLSLLKDGIFIVILFSSASTAIGYTNFIILLPAYALSMGYDKSDASILLSVVAAFDFIGRIGGAALSDLIVAQRKWFYILGLLGSGVSLALLPIAQEYWPLVSFCSAFGLTSGIYIGVTAVILADFLGIDRLGSSYGITLFLNGIVQLAGPPICGALLEYFHSYIPIFVGLGFTLMLGAALWIFTPFIERHRRRQADAECKLHASGINSDEKRLQHLTVLRLKESEAV